MLKLLWLWGPVLGWMGVLFGFSEQSGPLPGPAIPDWVSHGSVYAVLGVLLCRALAGGLGRRLSARQALLAVAIATAYGVTDEYHQSFTPGRTPDVYDVLKDLGGSSLGAALCLVLAQRLQSRS